MVHGQRLSVGGNRRSVNGLPLAANLLLTALIVVSGSACRKPQPLSRNLNVENRVAMRTVALYFESPQLLLVPEQLL